MYDKMLLTKIGSVVILISLFFSLLTSCKGGDDPFAAEPADTAADAVSDTAAGTAAEPGPDFYSMTYYESRDRYGVFEPNAFSNSIDDKYLYSYREYGAEGSVVKTLCRREYPDGTEWRPDCSDPLCTHGAGCPFEHCDISFVCFEGKIYFISNKPSAVYVYEPQINKSSRLIEGYSDFEFLIRGGKFYVKGASEKPDLSSSLVFFRISGDGTYDMIGELDSWYSNMTGIRPFYEDRYIIDAKLEYEDGNLKAYMGLRDIQNGDETEVFSKDFPLVPAPGRKLTLVSGGTFVPCMIYGDKVLSQIDFKLFDIDENAVDYLAGDTKTVVCREYHLTDIKTHEDEIILATDQQDARALLYYTQKYVFYMDDAKRDVDDFVVIMLDPLTGEKTSYNITEAVTAAGYTMPNPCKMTELQNGALIMSTDYYVKINIGGLDMEMPVPGYALAYDLQSGRIFKYGRPSEDLLNALAGVKS